MISLSVSPFFPITKPGFLASIRTSPTEGSKAMLVISASFGTISNINFSASSGGRRTSGSGLTLILFFKTFARSFISSPSFIIASGFFTYITNSGPSNSISVIFASFGTI
ncbi:109aa long hypothetical protein [Pyrococcus horikoshii OT3]|uniref:Uncharacterized protein n=1 Tax=Pyrococcus horikoshii (strain ATCC 700860 / DSM 12428 / JCM 9974 / NBRC 100139 / OT-3) TaxID=70601 RepID=O50113_PYRHO|nr:109aa long hypothetical protein [Pyrococcus horikoshii OT3]